MSQELRIKILLHLERHSRTGSPYFVGEAEIAKATGESALEIRRQLDILESQGLTTEANSQDGHEARISPAGTLAVESLLEVASQPERAAIGFKGK